MSLNRPEVVLCIEPRFSGGTSAAVAREIYLLSRIVRLRVVAIRSKLFKGDELHPSIEAALIETNTPIVWDPPVISADIVALHNPSFLKAEIDLSVRIFCGLLAVVAHENFLRPSGALGFDVGHCLNLISRVTTARHKRIAPVSGWNRSTVERWISQSGEKWQVLDVDWTNICDFELQSPVHEPRDRRGRLSRPGMEKFPPLDDLRKMFSDTSELVRILGADHLIGMPCPDHWELLPFGAEPVDRFIGSIDFMIYYTNPCWRESFGRVIAEAVAAGKVVITDPETSRTFGAGVISAHPHEVDSIVESLCDSPADYREQVLRGQRALLQFGAESWVERFDHVLAGLSSDPSQLETIYDLL